MPTWSPGTPNRSNQQGRAAGLTLFLAKRTAWKRASRSVSIPAATNWHSIPDLLADRCRARPADAGSARAHRRVHEAGRHRLVRHPRCNRSPRGPGGGNHGPGMRALRRMLSSLDIPELEPVPREHVLTKTFYLLKEFPGRSTPASPGWRRCRPPDDDEQASRPARAGDGVSPISSPRTISLAPGRSRQDGEAMLPLVLRSRANASWPFAAASTS